MSLPSLKEAYSNQCNQSDYECIELRGEERIYRTTATFHDASNWIIPCVSRRLAPIHPAPGILVHILSNISRTYVYTFNFMEWIKLNWNQINFPQHGLAMLMRHTIMYDVLFDGEEVRLWWRHVIRTLKIHLHMPQNTSCQRGGIDGWSLLTVCGRIVCDKRCSCVFWW